MYVRIDDVRCSITLACGIHVQGVVRQNRRGLEPGTSTAFAVYLFLAIRFESLRVGVLGLGFWVEGGRFAV